MEMDGKDNKYYVAVSQFVKRNCGCRVTMKSDVVRTLSQIWAEHHVHHDIYIKNKDIYSKVIQTVEVYDDTTLELISVISNAGGE
jgi:hypothetical protein